MARAESSPHRRSGVAEDTADLEDIAGVEGMINYSGCGAASQYLPGSSGVFAFPLPGSWSFDSCSFYGFLGKRKELLPCSTVSFLCGQG